VADVARPLGIGRQIGLIAALRWRIFRNALRQRGAKLELLSLILSGLFGALFVIGLAIGFGASAYFMVSSGRFALLTFLFWIVFVAWQLLPIFFAGFTTQFDFRNLLRFPLSHTAFFALSLAYGLADPTALGAIVWLAGITIGASLARAGLLPAMLLVCALFAVMNALLERLVGSWLARLLARRRTREILFAVFILLMVSLQFSGMLIEQLARTHATEMARVRPIFQALPPGFAGRAVASAASGSVAGFALGLSGVGGYALLFGLLLWQRLKAQYRGEDLSETSAPAAQRKERIVVTAETTRLLPPAVSAMVMKEIRYLRRNSIVLINLLIPLMLVLLFSSRGLQVRPPGAHGGAPHIPPQWIFPAAMGYVMLLIMGPAYNCFGYDGRGMQTLVAAPVRFRDVLLGKNIVLAMMLVFEALLTAIVLALRSGLPRLPVLAGTCAALVFATLGQLIIANWSSLNFPRRLEFGAMRNQRASGMAVLLALGVQIVLLSACTGIFLLGGWLGDPWISTGVFAILAAAAAGGYAASLDPLSGLAEKNRELLLEKLWR
jgi:ABC-2 type transport system permease protein